MADDPTFSDSARNVALRLLGRRDYTTKELRKKLADRGYSLDAIDTLVADLTASRLLDDRRVAAAHVRTATAVKGRGHIRIGRELSARGIPRAIIDDVLGTIESRDEATAIRQILARKKWPKNPSLADRRRMFQHLLRKGFSAGDIRAALGRGSDEDAAD